MNLLHYLKLNSSISRFALGIAFGTLAISGVSVSHAAADELIYNDESPNNILQTLPSFVSFLGNAYSNALYVGTTSAPSASNNTVVVDYTNGVKQAPYSVFGGIVQNGTSQNNKVIIKNGNVSTLSRYGLVAGGYGKASDIGDVTVVNNSVEIDSGTINADIIGGYGTGINAINVMNNIVKINNIVGNMSVAGGYADTEIDGDKIIAIVNNNLEINSSNIHYSVYGGVVNQEAYISNAGNNRVSVMGNSVTINDSMLGSSVYGGFSMIPGHDDLSITDNNVTINKSNINFRVAGGYGENEGSVTASYNNVFIHDSNISYAVTGGYGYSVQSNGVAANNNTVTISGNSSVAEINGGDAGREFFDINNTQFTAINNTVTLIGDQIKIGYLDADGNITSYGIIYGGRRIQNNRLLDADFDYDIKGNTLNLVGYRGTVSGIYNFENFNWTLPSNVVNGDVLITISNRGEAVDLTNTKHTIVDMQASDNRLKAGDEITFISKSKGDFAPTSYTIKQGQFIVYDATLSQKGGEDNPFVLTIGDVEDTSSNNENDGNNGGDTGSGGNDTSGNDNSGNNNGNDNGTIEGNDGNTSGNGNAGNNNNNHAQSAAKVNPQSKSYSEGRAAALGFLNQANDLISEAGIDKVRIMVRSQEDKVNRSAFIPFLLMNGSYQSYKTGSHVDIKGFNMAAGLATGFEFGTRYKATVGAFFEYGHGTYDTYNSFTNFASVHGDGNSTYKGGGIFGRIDFIGTGLGRVKQLAFDQADGFYVEASFKAGRISNEFAVGRNVMIDGNFAGVYRGSYDSKSTYYGGHVAGGYVFNFDEKQSLDVYGRYLWTHMEGDTVTIANEKLRFGDSTSSRLRIGGRYSYAYSDQFKPYVGAAYEYEFDGEVRAKAYEFNLERPSLKGGTGIFEAGFNFQPIATNSQLSINMNAQAYIGQRQGGGGGIKLKYQF